MLSDHELSRRQRWLTLLDSLLKLSKHYNIVPFLGYHLSNDQLDAWMVTPYMGNGNVVSYLRGQEADLTMRLRLVRSFSGMSILDYAERLQIPLIRPWTYSMALSSCILKNHRSVTAISKG